MEKIPLLCISLVAFGGLTKGAGVLPDGPLSAAVGESVMFTTTFTPTNEPLFSVSWKCGDKDIITLTNVNKTAPEYEGRITLFIYTGSLELRNVALNESGEYKVTFIPPGESQVEGNIRLNVYELVSNVTATANTTDLVEFISSVRLSCSSSGSPPFSFLWLNGSSEVTESDRVQLTDGNSTLTIVNVTRYDQGPFRCRVFNPFSNDTSDPVNLSISFGPENTKLTISPSKEQYEEGSDITLTCSTVSSPAAQFYWFLNGVKLSETEQELRLINTHRNQSGNYSCQAFNNKTDRYETSQPVVVSVLGKISGANITSSTNLPIEGNSVNLTCDAAGPVVSREWMKDGSDLNLNDNMILYSNDSVLSFSSLKKSDSGEYSCNISNPVNFVEVKYIMIVNYGPDNVHITGPNEIHLGQMLKLTCSADSTPSAGFTWKLNGTEIHNSDVFTKKNTELSDSGNYICEAMNAITGRTSPSAVHTLSVTEKPSGCSSGCIAGIVVACLVVLTAAAVIGYFIYKKRKRTKNSSSGNTHKLGGEGQVNTAYSGNQEPHYADIRLKKSRHSGAARMESEDNATQYAEIRVNNNPPAVSSPPSYDAHMQQRQMTAPQRYQNVTQVHA